MPPCHGGGRGFESRPFRKKSSSLKTFFYFKNFHFSNSLNFFEYRIISTEKIFLSEKFLKKTLERKAQNTVVDTNDLLIVIPMKLRITLIFDLF
jgi:hypothetical protein